MDELARKKTELSVAGTAVRMGSVGLALAYIAHFFTWGGWGLGQIAKHSPTLGMNFAVSGAMPGLFHARTNNKSQENQAYAS